MIGDKFFMSTPTKNYTYTSIWMIASKCEDRWVLLSHGSKINVKARYDEMTQKYTDAGLYNEVNDLYLFDVTSFGIVEINKAIEITNYVGHLVNADKLLEHAKQILKYL